MMNRSSDPYVSPFMSFSSNAYEHTNQSKNLWDFKATSTINNGGDGAATTPTTNHFQLYNNPNAQFLDYPPSFLLPSSLPYYSGPSGIDYPPPPPAAISMVKREDQELVGGGDGIGLNLGQRTYFSSSDADAIDRLFARSRVGLYAAVAVHQPPRCQAEDCKADLSAAKHYHRRHKVCAFHSKATVVLAAGLQQRFCQQCSRFHVLSEFDEAKRSCRKRLADHNRRRRKPQQNSAGTSTNSSEKCKQNSKQTMTSMTSSSNASGSLTAGSNCVTTAGFGSHGPTVLLGEQKMMMSSSSSSSTAYFNHNSLQSAAAAAARVGISDDAVHRHHRSNLLHLGQTMFEVDFM